jgi:hypothetical protein
VRGPSVGRPLLIRHCHGQRCGPLQGPSGVRRSGSDACSQCRRHPLPARSSCRWPGGGDDADGGQPSRNRATASLGQAGPLMRMRICQIGFHYSGCAACGLCSTADPVPRPDNRYVIGQEQSARIPSGDQAVLVMPGDHRPLSCHLEDVRSIMATRRRAKISEQVKPARTATRSMRW